MGEVSSVRGEVVRGEREGEVVRFRGPVASIFLLFQVSVFSVKRCVCGKVGERVMRE
jgi:hypothetical protein